MLDLTVTAPATDTRIVLPSALVSALGVTAGAPADALADRVSQLVADRRDMVGRDLWRQAYTERVEGVDQYDLQLARWPIEGDPTIQNVFGLAVEFGPDRLDARVTGRNRHSVYRRNGWERPAERDPVTGERVAAPSAHHYTANYTAGYLMPGQIVTWSAALDVNVGGSAAYDEDPGWVRATARSVALRFEATVGGTTDATTEPVWPTVVDGTVVDGSVTWTARAARELPVGLTEAAQDLAAHLQDLRDKERDVKREEADRTEIEYFQASTSFPESILAPLRSFA